MFGLSSSPKGKRKEKLNAACEGVLELFASRIPPFDMNAACRYSDLAVKARAAAKGFPTRTALSPP